MIKNLHFALLGAALASSPVMANEPNDTEKFEFYGTLRIMLEEAEWADGTEFKDASSRVGIKASKDLGDGLAVFGQYEVQLDLAGDGDAIGDMRLGHIGFDSEELGRIAFGKVESPFYTYVGSAADYPWWNSAPVYYTIDGERFVDETVMYTSPAIGDLEFTLLQQIDADTPTDNEQFQASVSYSAGNVNLAASYTDTADGNDLYGASIMFEQESFFIHAGYMDKENVGNGLDAIIAFPSGKNLYTLGISEYKDDGDEDFTAGILAFERSLHDNVLIWAEFMAWDGSLYGDVDSNQLNIGVNFDFQI